MPHADLSGFRLYYEVHGQGPALFCVSGYSVDHSPWLGLTKTLQQQFQVVLFHNRGIGESSDLTCPYTIEQFSDDTIALMDHLDIKTAYFMGNSMGGAIVQTLCYRHPKRVIKAVISNSFACFEHLDSRWRLHNAASLKMTPDPRNLSPYVENGLAWVFSERYCRNAEHIQQLLSLSLNDPHPPTLPNLKHQWSALQNFDARPHLKNIQVPCLVVSGDDDIIAPEKSAEYLANHIPAAQYHCFKETGHAPFIEFPQEYLSVVQRFLSLEV
jgi:pimeloyl-ACP methyl ester carboxylesterase